MADQIKKNLSIIFLNKIKIFNSSIITVTKVKMSSDLRLAKIYLSIFGKNDTNEADEFKNIIKERKKIRYELGSSLQSKYVPQIKFIKDEPKIINTNLFNM